MSLNTGLSYPHPNKTGSFFITLVSFFPYYQTLEEEREEQRQGLSEIELELSTLREEHHTLQETLLSDLNEQQQGTQRVTNQQEFMYCNFKQFFSEEYLNIQRLRPYGHVKDLDSLAKVAFARARVCNFEVIWLLRNFSLVNDFKTVHALKMEMTNRILYFSNLIHTSRMKISQSAMQGLWNLNFYM